jgi:Skp family chaperone for outer membrane proteins
MSLRVLLLGTLIAATTTSAFAQSASAPRPAGQPLGGPVVPGVCFLSREAIFANALVGKAATKRLQDLAHAAQAQIDAQRTPLETEAKALQGQADSPQARQKREALAQRWQALQTKASENGRQVEATRVKALQRIATEAQPIIAQVYGQKGCGLLLDRNAALGGNFANDLTADVVRGVDAKIQTISFDLEPVTK